MWSMWPWVAITATTRSERSLRKAATFSGSGGTSMITHSLDEEAERRIQQLVSASQSGRPKTRSVTLTP